MAEWNDDELDLAVAISLSQPETEIYEIKSETDRDEVWLDELSREDFNEQLDLNAFDTSYDDLDDGQLYKQTSVPYTPTKPSIYEVAHEYHELNDPTPSIYNLFTEFDQIFFNSSLGSVSLEWSYKMTSCAGITYFNPTSKFCYIRLSKPILALRPRKDLVETLLHEMIHALLFVSENNRDHSDHGPQFQYHQKRINNLANCNITIFHSFHDEVKSLKKHWWRCQGPCRYRQPFYGYVKRAVNRAPGKSDHWWRSHQDTCGGKFVKIRSPEPKKTEKAKIITKSAKISELKTDPNLPSQVDYQNRIGTIEHSFGTQAEPNQIQSGTIASQSSSNVKSTMEIATSPIIIQDSDDEANLEPTSSNFTPPSPMCTSPPIYSQNATQSASKNRNSPRFSPYSVSTQNKSIFSPKKVLDLQECLFCSGFFRKECFEEHFNDCVKSFPTD